MDVDVDELRRDVDEQHDGWMAAEIERVARACCGVRQYAIAYEPSVDEEVLIATAAETESPRDESARARRSELEFEIRQVRFGITADHLRDTFARRSCRREIEHDATVMFKSKGVRRERQRV